MNGGYGLYLSDCDGTASNRNLIANNYIQSGGTSASTNGIYLYYSDYTDLYYNSLNHTNTNATSAALYILYGTNVRLANNIIRAENGYTIYHQGTTTITTSDYNDFFTNGVNIGYWNTFISNLATWQSTTGFDANSIFEDPIFTSDTTFTVNNSSLNNTGTPIASVTNDIEGEARDATNPDIGANEFMLPADDAGIAFVTPPAAPFAPTDQIITANLKNYGADSLFNVDIYWSINDTLQPVINWTGILLSGDTTTVTLGLYDFDNQINYNIKAFTTLPNGNVDIVVLNDTAIVNDVVAAFAGIYTLGGTTPDFVTFNEAAYWLNLGGLIAPVTVNIRDGIYNEQVSFGEIPGTDTLTQLVFQSENQDSSLVSLQYNANFSNPHTLKLVGADWTTFQHITIQGLNTNYARTITLDSASTHITLQIMLLTGPSNVSNSSYRSIIYSYNTSTQDFSPHYLRVLNNRIVSGSYGVHLRGYNTSNPNIGIEVSNNQFINQIYYGLYIVNQDRPEIISNIISTTVAASGYNGIYLNATRNGYTVTNNRISGTNPTYGLYIYDADGTAVNRGLIANNFVQTGGNSSTGRAAYVYASDYLDFYHNSLNNTNVSTSSAALYVYYNQNSNFINNNVVSSNGGYAIYNDYILRRL
ncbi:MAG: hypothetical protein HC803_01975 [Saprospiraceae bacterium]|nr:hypothetical protein [Saprospiraceae bacterium]